MPRIRTIKPEFFDDEKLSHVSRDARLTFIGLLIYSDDYGVVKGNARWLNSRIFPYDDLPLQTFEGWLSELNQLGLIIPFTVNAETYLFIRNFNKHQVIDRPSKTRNPEPPTDILTNQEASAPRSVDEDSTRPNREIADGKGEGRGKGNGTGVHSCECVAAPHASGNESPAPESEIDKIMASAAEPQQIQDLEEQPEKKNDKSPIKFTPADLMALWNEMGCRPTVIKLTEARRKKAAVRIRQRDAPGWWRDLLTKICGLQARDRPWLTFDFVIGSENNLLKIIEGNYDKDFSKSKKPAIAEGNQPTGTKIGKYSRFVSGRSPGKAQHDAESSV